MVLFFSVLAACSNDQEAIPQEGNESTDEEVNGTEETEVEEGSGLIERNTDDDEEDTNGSSPNLGEGSTEDQIDLTVGDTGTIETTIQHFELTIDSVAMDSNLDGEKPDLDTFILVDVTIKNLHNEPLKLEETVEIFEVTSDLDGGGYWPVSELYDVDVDELSGELSTNESVSGQILFENNEGEEHYIRIRSGLVAASAVKNQVIWTLPAE
nr:DUF4352 domain-containing protein [Shouchella lehensis]